jgi:FAD/FMN-containing dehydrogenase
VYAHFYRENQPDVGFAAVPFSEKGGYRAGGRQFDPNGILNPDKMFPLV